MPHYSTPPTTHHSSPNTPTLHLLRGIPGAAMMAAFPMQSQISFAEAIHLCLEKDPRYHPAAYDLVRDALHLACTKFRDGADDKHVSGQELLDGFREHVIREFGPMSLTLLEEWGVTRGLDVGHIVYNLIDVGYFGKNEGDSLEDFDGGYDFATAFTTPFLPSSQRPKTASSGL